MQVNARINRSSQCPGVRRWLNCIGIIAVAVAFALPAAADRRGDSDSDSDSDHTPGESCALIDSYQFDDPAETGLGDVTLDQIVPQQIQDRIINDRDSLTGTWVSELELFTNVSP